MLASGERSSQHRRSCGAHLPTGCRPDRCILRVSVRWCSACHHPTAASAEPADNIAHRANDCRRFQVSRHPQLGSGDLNVPIDTKYINIYLYKLFP